MTTPAVSRLQILEVYFDSLVEVLGLEVSPEFRAAVLGIAHETIIIGGVRAGKSTALALILLMAIFELRQQHPEGGEYPIWLVAPDYKQGRREITYLYNWTMKLGWAQEFLHPKDGPWELQLDKGVLVSVRSAQHPETLASEAPYFIGVCEAGQTSDEVREQLRLRSMENNCPIVHTGTLEDDEGHQQWAWYQESAQAWQDEPTTENTAFSLPSWSNLKLYGDCRPYIEKTPEIANWCPDGLHPHSGRDHPIIRREERILSPYIFQRKIAAVPTGVQFQVYPQTVERPELLRHMTGEDLSRPVLASAGGVDYGTVHPSAIVVVQLLPDERDSQVSFVGPKGVAWVRECWFADQDPGDYDNLNRARKLLSERYKVWNWITDPNERYMAKSWQGQQVSYSQASREARIGLVSTRLNLGKLCFDLAGPGVRDLFLEMQRVHRRKTRDGQLVLVREGDDRTAALEDAIHGLDQYFLVPTQKPMRLGYARRSSRTEFQAV